MIQRANVVRVNDGWAAEVKRSDACAKCGACQHAHEEILLYPLPEGDYREGDVVEIRLPDAGAFSASAIAYGIPIACLLLGLWLGSMLGLPELVQGALALAALAGGFFILKSLEPRIERSGRYAPRFDCRTNRMGGHNDGH